jgi:hypothetical protein
VGGDIYNDRNWRPKVFVCPDSLKELIGSIVRGDDCEEIRLNYNCTKIVADYDRDIKALFAKDNVLKKCILRVKRHLFFGLKTRTLWYWEIA